MVFSHLSFFSPLSEKTFNSSSSKIDRLSLINEQELDQIHQQFNCSSSLPFFIPFFQKKDQVLGELYQAAICDLEGNPCKNFNFLEIPAEIESFEGAKTSIQAILKFLQKSRQLETEVLQDGKKSKQLEISLNLAHFLKRMIESSQESRLAFDQEGNYQGTLPPIPIQDIQLIGSRAVKELKEVLRQTCQHFFGQHIAPTRIKEWFEMEHIKRSFTKEVHDCDLRILSPGSLHEQAALSNMCLRTLADSMTGFDSSFYIQQLKSKHPKYQSLENQNLNTNSLKELSILEFGGISKRKLVDLPKTKYAILAIKILNEKPFDLLYVGLKNGRLTLENSNLSSTNCWTISIFRLLVERNQKNWSLKIGSQPFTASKALIDLLCGISTIHEPNVDAWIRFVRDGIRSMQRDIEHQMVQNVLDLKFREEFLRKKYLKSTDDSTGEYLYYLLEREIQKNFVNSHAKKVDPYQTIPILFRASLSLQTCDSLTDKECAALWHLAEKNGWFHFDDSSKDQQKSFLMTIQKAVIDERVPFSVVSAWISLLTWIWNPLSATSHCQRPVFHLTNPLSCLLPIQPIENGLVLQNYFSKHPFPSTFQLFYDVIASSHQAFTSSYPLAPYFNQLNIDPIPLKKLAEGWLIDVNPLLNMLGLQLYLEVSSLHSIKDKRNLNLIFRRLPEFLQGMAHSQQLEETIKALKALSPSASFGYELTLHEIEKQKNVPLNKIEWIAILVQTTDPELLNMAYALWKECENHSRKFVRQHAEIGWSLFQSLCAIHPRKALSLLYTLPDRTQFIGSAKQEFKTFTSLVQGYQKKAPQQFVCDLDQILPLVFSLFEKDQRCEFKNSAQQNAFSSVLFFLIEALYLQPFKETSADYFLLEACRKHYLTDLNWQTQILLTRLEKLISQPEKIGFAYALYQVIIREKFLDTTATTLQQLQKLKIQLGEALLKARNESFSLNLLNLDRVFEEEIESTSILPFYNWMLHLFQIQANHPSEEFQPQLLDVLLMATPPHKRFDTHKELYQFFQLLVKNLKSKTSNSEHSLAAFDKFLAKKELVPLIDQAAEEWKGLLLDYLETSSSLHATERFPGLWKVYEQILRISNKTKASTQVLRLCKNLSLLIECSSFSTIQMPSPLVLEWIKNKYEMILDKLKTDYPHETKVLLLALNRYGIPHRSLASYIWSIFQRELETSSSSIHALLDLDSFENLSAQVQPANYKNLPKLISTILATSPSRPSQAWQWLAWCFSSPNQDKIFEHSAMMEACLKCAEQFVNREEFADAFHILIRLSSLSQSQHERASSMWLQIASHLSTHSSAEMSRQLFLNKQFSLIAHRIADRLNPLIIKAIQRHLANPKHPLNSEQHLALDLLKEYDIKEASAWLALWKSLALSHDPEFVLKIWLNFKDRADALTGTKLEIADCWTQAFACVQKTKPSELLIYFDDSEWLDIYSDSTTTDLRWKAIETIFLAALKTLSPTRFDPVFFETILQKKLDLSFKILEKKEEIEQTAEFNYLAEFNRSIELALINHLQGSTNPVCLDAICRLLYPTISIHSQDPDKIGIYLPHFERVFSSFLKISPEADHPSFQSLSTSINQILYIVSKRQTAYHSACVSLVETLVVKRSLSLSTDTHIKIASQLVYKILEEGTLKDVESLKASFLLLIPHICDFPNDEPFTLIEFFLKISFNLMGLSFAEKGKLVHPFLKAALHDQSRIDDRDRGTKKMISLYVKWSPYLLAYPNLLKEIIEKIIPLIIPSDSNPNIDQFAEDLTKILDAKYQVKIPSSVNKEEWLHYHSLIIHEARNLISKPDFLIVSLKMYADKMIAQALEGKIDVNELMLFLEEFVHLYPSQSITWIEDESAIGLIKGFKVSHLQTASKFLLKKTFEKGLFNSHPEKLLSLQLWSGCYISDIKFIPKQHQTLLKKFIDKFLEEGHPFSISRAIQICHLLQKYLTSPQDYKTLFPFYQKILSAIQPHVRCKLQHDEFFHGTLFEYLDQQTRGQLPTNTMAARKFVCEVSNLYFQSILSSVKEMLSDPSAGCFEAHYLSLCFYLLKIQANDGAFENNYSSYLSILKEILPIVRIVEVEHAFDPDLETDLEVPNPSFLIKEWIEAVLKRPFSKSPAPLKITDAEAKEQHKLLFEGLHVLHTLRKNDNIDRLYHCLLTALLSICESKNPGFGYWLNPDQEEHVQLIESIRQSSAAYEDKVDPKKRLSLKLVCLEFTSLRRDYDYSSHLKGFLETLQLLSKIDFTKEPISLSNLTNPISRLILSFPKMKDEKQYHLQRKELLFSYLKHIQPILIQIPLTLLAKSQSALFTLLDGGIDQNLLQYLHASEVEIYESIKVWLNMNSDFSAPLLLLDLIFYQKPRCIKDLDSYLFELENFRDTLFQYTLKQKNFNLSRRYASFVLHLSIPLLHRLAILNDWMAQLFELSTISEFKEAAQQHMRELSIEAQNHGIFLSPETLFQANNLNVYTSNAQ